jgi:dethiobiotin synthetase
MAAHIRSPTLFVTGTDTGVGKTRTACAILHAARASGLRVGAYKPACSGAERDATRRLCWEDVDALSSASGGEHPSERICPQRFVAPLAPPAAAEAEGRHVDYEITVSGATWWDGQVDLLVVEGAGGWLCPLTESHTMADLAAELGAPVVVVAANRLGTINHTLLTLEAVRQRGLPVAAVVLSDVSPQADASAATNAEWLMRYADIPCLATLAHGDTQIRTRGRNLTGLDWQALAAPAR